MLCNGTRLEVNKLKTNGIKATVLRGCTKGEEVLIPNIPLLTSPNDMGFSFKRLQFPVRLCFVLSINKHSRWLGSIFMTYASHKGNRMLLAQEWEVETTSLSLESAILVRSQIVMMSFTRQLILLMRMP